MRQQSVFERIIKGNLPNGIEIQMNIFFILLFNLLIQLEQELWNNRNYAHLIISFN